MRSDLVFSIFYFLKKIAKGMTETAGGLNLRPWDAARPSFVHDSILKQFPKFQPSS
jgi:hypothetical protein